MQLSLPFVDVTIDITARRHKGNPESAVAHSSIQPHKTRLQQVILDDLKDHGPSICKEVEARTGLSHQTASARLTELKARGLVKKTGQRRDKSAVLTLAGAA